VRKGRASGIFIEQRVRAESYHKDPAQVLPDFAGRGPSIGLVGKPRAKRSLSDYLIFGSFYQEKEHKKPQRQLSGESDR
jgi:hypothetical protein